MVRPRALYDCWRRQGQAVDQCVCHSVEQASSSQIISLSFPVKKGFVNTVGPFTWFRTVRQTFPLFETGHHEPQARTEPRQEALLQCWKSPGVQRNQWHFPVRRTMCFFFPRPAACALTSSPSPTATSWAPRTGRPLFHLPKRFLGEL